MGKLLSLRTSIQCLLAPVAAFQGRCRLRFVNKDRLMKAQGKACGNPNFLLPVLISSAQRCYVLSLFVSVEPASTVTGSAGLCFLGSLWLYRLHRVKVDELHLTGYSFWLSDIGPSICTAVAFDALQQLHGASCLHWRLVAGVERGPVCFGVRRRGPRQTCQPVLSKPILESLLFKARS